MPDLKLAVEVCHARNLLARDADGSSSPFVVVEFDGQRLKTQTKDKDLNPSWNEKLEFKVRSKDVLDDNSIDVGVYTAAAASKSGQQRSLGSIKIPCSHVKSLGTEAANMVIPYSLERRNLFKSAFSRGRGELYLKLYHYEAAEVPVVKKEEAKVKAAAAEEEKAGGGAGDVKKTETTKPSEAAVKAVVVRAAGAEEVGSFDVKMTEPKLAPPKVVHDLVVSMEYVYVKVVKARGLAAKDVTGSSDPYVEVKVGGSKAVTETRKQTLNPEWNSVFAFESSKSQGTNNTVEIMVWDKDMLKTDDFLGYVGIDALEIPTRRPPDSPLAPQWYKLQQPPRQHYGGGAARVSGDIMLAVWYGTQADEAFHDAWQSDTAGISLNKSKVYVSPRLWYLRVSLIEAQDLLLPPSSANLDVLATVVLDGPHQQIHSRTAVRSNHGSSGSMKFGGGEILLVASEPFVDKLTIKLSAKVSKDKNELIGAVSFPLYNVPKRYDRKPVEPRWHELRKSEKKAAEEAEKDSKDGAAPPKPAIISSGRIYVSLSLEGGYHVLDETTHHTSDVQPADRRLWKPAMGILELGILCATGLVPTKTRDEKGTADVYCIAKYGNKWIRTRTVVGSLAPQWHEQYTWEVHDPCTVLTVGVFDNHLVGSSAAAASGKNDDASSKDAAIGKLRIRLSTLHSDRTYTHSYPLISVERSGLKKKGELEIAVRFSCTSQFHLLMAYGQPLLPKLHYAEPLGLQQMRALRRTATRIQMHYLQRAEPPLPAEAVRYMLDADAGTFSYRRTKATWSRMLAVIAGPRRLARWIHDICVWKNPMSTGLVILLYMTLVCFPEQILPTLFLYVCLVGTWHWRFRPTHPPHMDVRLSQVAQTSDEELDEEFDTVPSSRSSEVIRARYERLRGLAGRVQSELADLVAQMERIQALLSWRDPRATSIFLVVSFVIAVFLYVVPLRMVAVLVGIYVFRPPRFRQSHPNVPVSFFKRLPALSDSVI